MRAYFENIRTGYSGDFYNTFVYRFFSVSRAYVDSMNVQEWMIYGSSRIGTQVSSVNLVSRKIYADVSGSWYINPVIVDVNEPQVNLTSFVQVRGSKRYELSNHLGNVLSVVSDKKIFRCPSSLPADSTYFSAEVLSATDYSAFGAPLPGRSFDYLKDAVKVTVFADSFSVSGNTLGWSAYNVNTVVAQDNGRLKMTQATTWATARKSVNVIRGRNYIWRFKIDLGTFTRINAPVYNQNFSQHITGYLTITQSGTYEYRFTAHDFVVNLLFEAVPPAGPAGAVLYVDDISLEEDNRLDYAMRFGFNGKETDDEVVGAGNSYDFGDRMYSPRLGRWFSTDPLQKVYPGFSPYNYSLNSPISLNDPNGQWVERTVTRYDDQGKLLPGWKFWVKAKTIEISFTVHNVKMYNGSSIEANPDAMRTAADNLEKQIETNLTGTYENKRGQTIKTSVAIEGPVQVIDNLDDVVSEGPKSDNLIYVTDRAVLGGANGKNPLGSNLVLVTPEAAGIAPDNKEKPTTNTASHEFGHGLGLGHNRSYRSLMYEFGAKDRGSKLLPDDATKLKQTIYNGGYGTDLNNYDRKQKNLKK